MAAIHLLISNLVSPLPARAFAPEAAAAIASRLPSALPPAARWNPAWGDAAAAAVMEVLHAEDADPEATAVWRRFRAGSPLDPAAAGEGGIVVGLLPQRLANAATELRDAFGDGDDARITTALARVAIASTDLADPFQVTGCDLDEVAGARARFSDLLAGEDALVVGENGARVPEEALAAGVGLALGSAQERVVIEAAIRRGDVATVRLLRRARLEAALTVARAVTARAWQGAQAPVVPLEGDVLGRIHVSPNPARGMAAMRFALPRAGTARIQLLDASGRSVWQRPLGLRPAGAQGTVIGPGTLDLLPPGLYFVRVEASDYFATGRLVRVR